MNPEGEVSPSLQTRSRFSLPPLREIGSDFSPDPILRFEVEVRGVPADFQKALGMERKRQPIKETELQSPSVESFRKVGTHTFS